MSSMSHSRLPAGARGPQPATKQMKQQQVKGAGERRTGVKEEEAEVARKLLGLAHGAARYFEVGERHPRALGQLLRLGVRVLELAHAHRRRDHLQDVAAAAGQQLGHGAPRAARPRGAAALPVHLLPPAPAHMRRQRRDGRRRRRAPRDPARGQENRPTGSGGLHCLRRWPSPRNGGASPHAPPSRRGLAAPARAEAFGRAHHRWHRSLQVKAFKFRRARVIHHQSMRLTHDSWCAWPVQNRALRKVAATPSPTVCARRRAS